MADRFCRKCGAPLSEGARMCKYCLAPVEDGEETGLEEVGETVTSEVVNEVEVLEAGIEKKTAEEVSEVRTLEAGFEKGAAEEVSEVRALKAGFEKGAAGTEIEKGVGYAGRNPYRIYGVLAYLGIAVLVPIIFKMNVKFVRFHVNQGLVLFILESFLSVIYGFAGGIPILAMVVSLLRLLCVALMLLGAISAVRGLEKPLPVVGKIHLIREG